MKVRVLARGEQDQLFSGPAGPDAGPDFLLSVLQDDTGRPVRQDDTGRPVLFCRIGLQDRTELLEICRFQLKF